MGCSTGLIYKAITRGVWAQRTTVKLPAEKLTGNARPTYRIHDEDFVEFLRAIGWPRIPTRSG